MHRSTRLLLLAAAAVAALLLTGASLAVNGVPGTYKATIKSPASVKGKWALTLARDGSYVAKWNGRVAARGTYTANSKTVTFGREPANGCKGTGTYAWKRSGKTLTFTMKREHASCQGRAAVLLATPFKVAA
jgi:hypothetical protein